MVAPRFSLPVAWYIRVSDEEQDASSQRLVLAEWSAANGLPVPPPHLIFEDVGWARWDDVARPAFNSLLRAAESGQFRTVLIAASDRFDADNPRQVIAYVERLHKAGVALYSTSENMDLTAADPYNLINLVMKSSGSHDDIVKRAHRSIKGGLQTLSRGEWGGGKVPYGMEVVCFGADGSERWRLDVESIEMGPVKSDGKRDTTAKRVKILPNGDRQRYDGKYNTPRAEETETLRLRPTRDETKLAAVRTCFEKYGNEAVSVSAIATHLNGLGLPYKGGRWESWHVRELLRNPIYTGRQRYNYSAQGKAAEWDVEAKNFREVKRVPSPKGRKKLGRTNTRRPRSQWVLSPQLFPPVVDVELWEAVQGKLESETKKLAPRNSSLWLAGLLVCGGCGRPMRGMARTDKAGKLTRAYYYCGSHAAKVEGCKCGPNFVRHDKVEPLIRRYLQETGNELAVWLNVATSGDLTLLAPLKEKHVAALRRSVELYDLIAERVARREYPSGDEFAWALPVLSYRAGVGAVDDSLTGHYRAVFTAEEPGLRERLAALDAEIELRTERLVNIDPKNRRAVEMANAKLAGLQAERDGVDAKLVDVAAEFDCSCRTVRTLQESFDRAAETLDGSASDDRRKAEAVRGCLRSAVCHFGGDGVRVDLLPVAGGVVTFTLGASAPASR